MTVSYPLNSKGGIRKHVRDMRSISCMGSEGILKRACAVDSSFIVCDATAGRDVTPESVPTLLGIWPP